MLCMLCSIYHAIVSDVKVCTGILRPWETVSLYVSSRPGATDAVTVTLTGNSRVLSLEQCAQWLESVKTALLDQTILLL